MVAFLFSCGGQATDGDQGATDPQQPLPASEGVEGSGTITLRQGAETNAEELSIALRWVIEDGPFPPHRTTGMASIRLNEDGEFDFRASERPPPEALVANEATRRDRFAVAYVMAYVDANTNGTLDCRNPGDCDDIHVGASPNTLVVFAEEDWPAEGEPLLGFDCAPGVRPSRGWSLVHLDPPTCGRRPTARAWTDADTIELVVIGDFREQGRSGSRQVRPDVD